MICGMFFRTATFLAAAAAAASTAAEEPVGGQAGAGPSSVIPWLDQAVTDAARSRTAPPSAPGGLGTPPSLSTEPRARAPYETAPPAAGGPASVSGPGVAIEVAPLGDVDATAAGVIGADQLGLPVDAWRGVNAEDAAELVAGLSPGASRAANVLAVDLLSAAFEPPAAPALGFGGATNLLSARLAALARFGALERAVELARTAGPDKVLAARSAALVSGADDVFCQAALVAEVKPLDRIYCLAAIGDGAGASLAVQATRSLGGGDEATLSLLEALAEPALAAYAQPPAAARDATPLRLAAMRRLRLPPPADFSRAAPLSLLPAATDAAAPPRARLEALERLEAAGGVSTTALRAAYEASASAESGGVWGRVEAYRRALAAPAGAFAAAARAALARAREEGREATMARLLGPAIAQRVASGAGGAALAAPEIVRAAWLAGEWDAARALSGGGPVAGGAVEARALAAIASAAPSAGDGFSGRASAAWRPEDADPLFARAARGDGKAARLAAGLLALGAPTNNSTFFEAAPDLAFAVGEGRVAEIAFAAAAGLGGDAPLSGPALFAALSNLVAVGLEDPARRIAIEAALLD